MKLRTIVENVEKLIPHLKADIEKYLDIRQAAGLPNPITKQSTIKAVEWALRCDPMFLKGKASGKPLTHIKSPFVKHVIRWWLDPNAGGGIELPEDIETTGEILKKFSNAKQRGLNVEVSSIGSWAQLNQLMAPYLSDEDAAPVDRYSRMGFKMIFHDGPWKVYLIDKWVPGSPSDLYPDQIQHKAFEGAQWCVKYENTFKNTYKPSIYGLVLYNERRFALMHINSLQFKAPNDRGIYHSDPEKGAEFLKKFFAAKPKLFNEVLVNSLTKSYGDDFANFIPLLNVSMPNPEEMRAVAEKKGPAAVVKVAKYTNAWPHFDNWPKGRQIILADTDNHVLYVSNEAPTYMLVTDVGRIPEVEQKILESGSIPAASKYVKSVLAPSPFRKPAPDVVAMGRLMNSVLINSIKTGTEISKTIQWGSDALKELRKMGAEGINSEELEKIILQSQDPVAVLAYASAIGGRWLPGEPLLSLDERTAKKYCSRFKISPLDLLPDKTENSAMKEVRKAIAKGDESDNEELILSDLHAALLYAQHVVGPWPELEQQLEETGTAEQQEMYRRNVLRL